MLITKIIETLISKIQGLLTWHLFPKSEDLKLKSALECLFYLVVTCSLLSLFYYWNKVPNRKIYIAVSKLQDKSIDPHLVQDSAAAFITCYMPKTTVRTSRNAAAIIFSYSTRYKWKDSLANRKQFIWPSPKYNLSKEDSVILDIISIEKNRDLLGKLKSSYPQVSDYNIYYNAVANDQNPLNSFDTKEREYPYPLKNEAGEKTGEFCYVRGNYTSSLSYRCEDFAFKEADDEYSFNSYGALAKPSWYKFEDISQSYYNIRLLCSNLDSLVLTMDFEGAVEFSNMYPEPDDIGMSFISFYDKSKILYIIKHGLVFHAKFKELENMQTIRMFAVTAILGGIAVVYVGLFFIALAHFFRWFKRHPYGGISIIILLILIIFECFNLFAPIKYYFGFI